MRNIFFDQCFGHGHDLGNSGFIIGTKNGCTVCCDQGASGKRWKMREIFYGKGTSTCAKRQITAIVVLVYDRDDVMVTVIGNGIHVCDKSDRWFILISWCGRNLSIYIAEFIQTYVRNPEGSHLICQNTCQIELTLGRRRSRTVFITWGTDYYII